ncbi:MAG: hypothetical protein ABH872_00190 [Candidatus Omnitrophota bacterium]
MGKSEEKRKSCSNCNKSLKRVDWHYSNGLYFCNKSCSKAHARKKEKSL